MMPKVLNDGKKFTDTLMFHCRTPSKRGGGGGGGGASIRKGHARTHSEPFHAAPVNVSTDATGVEDFFLKGTNKTQKTFSQCFTLVSGSIT